MVYGVFLKLFFQDMSGNLIHSLAGVGIVLAILSGALLVIYKRKWRLNANKTGFDTHLKSKCTSNQSQPGSIIDSENFQGPDRIPCILDASKTKIYVEKDQSLCLIASKEGSECSKIKHSAELTEKVLDLHSTSKREVNRDRFRVGDEIGSGNFGKVYEGLFEGLFDDHSLQNVAIKSINRNELNETDLENMISEIKVMSNIPPHINIASMIASCSSQFMERGELWLILELCPHGDLKNFLMENKATILSGTENDVLSSRCLATWTYQIANGMKFLASNQIMHGDLAARNILMGQNPLMAKLPVAKVADFGLSKSFNDYIIYEKKERQFVPWRWMALEYLNDGIFTLKSDVWSFGVLLWEIFAFGKTPYGHQGYDEVLENLQSGYKLPCPKDIKSVDTWAAVNLYETMSELCFVPEPKMRANFSDLVTMLEKELGGEEVSTHEEMSSKYLSTQTAQYLKIKRV